MNNNSYTGGNELGSQNLTTSLPLQFKRACDSLVTSHARPTLDVLFVCLRRKRGNKEWLELSHLSSDKVLA